jgi:ADP-ribose pyrophosphatase YjhB (NUDIX family)
MQYAHCSYCGAAYAEDASWPRVCSGCGEITWRNPLPVAVALLPVDTDEGRGLVVVRRDIDPGRGQLGLPGGYIEAGEQWRDAAVRELLEETTIEASAADVTLFDVHSTPSGFTLLVFGLLPPRPASALPPSVATEEAIGYEILVKPQELVFSTHTDAMASYFASLR